MLELALDLFPQSHALPSTLAKASYFRELIWRRPFTSVDQYESAVFSSVCNLFSVLYGAEQPLVDSIILVALARPHFGLRQSQDACNAMQQSRPPPPC